jgi:hypothetical protein
MTSPYVPAQRVRPRLPLVERMMQDPVSGSIMRTVDGKTPMFADDKSPVGSVFGPDALSAAVVAVMTEAGMVPAETYVHRFRLEGNVFSRRYLSKPVVVLDLLDRAPSMAEVKARLAVCEKHGMHWWYVVKGADQQDCEKAVCAALGIQPVEEPLPASVLGEVKVPDYNPIAPRGPQTDKDRTEKALEATDEMIRLACGNLAWRCDIQKQITTGVALWRAKSRSSGSNLISKRGVAV